MKNNLSKLKFLASAALFGSGAAALVYQVLWMRSFGLIFGNTTKASSLVLAVFMGGLSLGGYLCRKLTFKNALRSYAWLELLMAGSALLGGALLTLLPRLSAALAAGTWEAFLLKTAATAAITLPTAMAAGMTLPVLAEALKRRGLGSSTGFAGLYRVNTLGAALGALASAYLLIPTLGTAKTYAVAVLVNLVIGLVAWGLSSEQEKVPAPNPLPQAWVPEKSLPWLAFAAGFSAFLLEVVWVRSLVLVIGSSTYAFSVMLGAILTGIALGAWAYQGLQARIRQARTWLAWTCLFISLMTLASYAAIGLLPDISMKVFESPRHSFLHVQGAAFLMSFFALLLVTLPQGFLFPLLLSSWSKDQLPGQEQMGSLYLWNTLGALAGSLGAGLLLIPLAGLRAVYLLAFVCSLSMGLGLLLGLMQKSRVRPLAGAIGLAFALLTAKFFHPWDPEVMTLGIYENGPKFLGDKRPEETLLQFERRSGSSLLYYAEGQGSVVSVKRLADGSSFLANNGKSDASDGGDLGTQKLIAHIPFAFSPRAKSVYVVGWGSGSTAGSAALHPVESIDCVEIEPRVFDTAPFFKTVNFGVEKDPRFKIHFNDGRNDLAARPGTYDLILSEPSNPWISGVSNLFTHEFYGLVRGKLNERGVFAQWFPYYGMSLEDIRLQVRTFCQSFPETAVWILADLEKPLSLSGDLLLIGSVKSAAPDYAELAKFFQDRALSEDLAKIGIHDPWSFAALQLLDRDEALSFAGPGPLNTDGHPRIEFSAPRSHARTLAEQALSNQQILFSLAGEKKRLYPHLLNSPLENAKLGKQERIRILGLLARHYSGLSLFAQSLKIVEEMESLGGQNASTAYYRGIALVFTSLEPGAGIRDLELALSLDPSDKKIYHSLCRFYLRSKRPQDALRVFSQGAARWPGDADLIFGSGYSSYQMGQFAEARALLEKTLNIDPHHRGARSLLAALPARPGEAPFGPRTH